MSFSTFLNGRASTQLRGLAWLSFSDTAILQAGTATSDSGGGVSTGWTNAGTFPCRIYPLMNRPMQRIVGGAIDERSTHVVNMPSSVSVDVANRIVISGRGTFEVTGVRVRTDAVTSVCEVMQWS